MPTAAPVDVPARPAPDPSAPPLRSLLAAGGIGAGTLLAIGGPWWIAADTASHRHSMFGLWLALAILTPISGIATVTYRLGRRHTVENRRLILLAIAEHADSVATTTGRLVDAMTRLEDAVATQEAKLEQLVAVLRQQGINLETEPPVVRVPNTRNGRPYPVVEPPVPLAGYLEDAGPIFELGKQVGADERRRRGDNGTPAPA